MAKTPLAGSFKKHKSTSQWWLDVPAGKFVSNVKPAGLLTIDIKQVDVVTRAHTEGTMDSFQQQLLMRLQELAIEHGKISEALATMTDIMTAKLDPTTKAEIERASRARRGVGKRNV